MTSSLCSSFRGKSPGRSATVLVLFFGIEYYIVPVGLCGCAKRGPGVVRKKQYHFLQEPGVAGIYR